METPKAIVVKQGNTRSRRPCAEKCGCAKSASRRPGRDPREICHCREMTAHKQETLLEKFLTVIATRWRRNDGKLWILPPIGRKAAAVIRMPSDSAGRFSTMSPAPTESGARRGFAALHYPDTGCRNPGLYAFPHKVDGLLRVQAPAGFSVRPLAVKPCENESGDQKMRH